MLCVMSKQRMVPYDRNTNIKRDWELSTLSTVLFLLVHPSVSCCIFLPLYSIFSVYPWWPPVCSASPCLPLSVRVPLCMSAASFWPDLHNPWSSILYIADALWCMDLYGWKVPPGVVGSGMSLKRTHTHTGINQSQSGRLLARAPRQQQHCSLFRGKQTRWKTVWARMIISRHGCSE